MQKLPITHNTVYTYSSPVLLGPHRLFVRPREGHDIRIAGSKLEISPVPTITWERDDHGNSVASAVFRNPTEKLSILSEVVVEDYDEEPLRFTIAERAEKFPFMFSSAERLDLAPHLTPSYPEDTLEVATWAARFWKVGAVVNTYSLLDAINRTIATEFVYLRREEPGVQRPSQTLARRSGSCRDLATLMIETCRYFGLPARFVSGYSTTDSLPADQGSTHAWTEDYLPGAGWKGFDSTGGVLTGPFHIAVAVGRDPEGFPPIAGSFSSQQPVSSSMVVSVQVKSEY